MSPRIYMPKPPDVLPGLCTCCFIIISYIMVVLHYQNVYWNAGTSDRKEQ